MASRQQHLDLELCSLFCCSASAISTSAGASERVRFLPRLWLRARARAALGSIPTLDKDSCTNPRIVYDALGMIPAMT